MKKLFLVGLILMILWIGFFIMLYYMIQESFADKEIIEEKQRIEFVEDSLYITEPK